MRAQEMVFLITLTNVLYAALVEDKGGREAIYNFKGQIESYGQRSLMGCSLCDHKESDMTEQEGSTAA